MTFFSALTNGGVPYAKNASDKKNVVLINCLSIVLASAVVVLMVFRYFVFLKPVDVHVFSACLLFLLPLLLNHCGWITLSSLCICWVPSLVILIIYIVQMSELEIIPTSTYDSLYIYLLGVSSIPFLVLNIQNKVSFFLGLIVPMCILFFCDPILDLFDLGHAQKGTLDDKYELTKMRAIVAYLILNGSCFSLKALLEEGDRKNEQLIDELATKNRIIKEQAREELQEAASRLTLATDSAGIGIWEWHVERGDLIWDKQMHKLCGIDYEKTKAKDWRNHIHPDDLPEMEEEVNRAIRQGTEFAYDFRTVWPDGTIRYLQTIGHTYHLANKPIRMVGACWDISDRKNSEEQMLQSEANLYATINNTTFSIWSINRNLRIINLNKPFKNYLRERYQFEVQEGYSIEGIQDSPVLEFSVSWQKNYIRALAGESFELTEEQNGRHFKYALNPIIENAMISGVTIFMEETTELKMKESALYEAHKQIGELKVMALRSAMNPHFIFNTLSSIQYFILQNDQLNAVNYLSTFSKLIRSILNNSVTHKIKLADELEQIKNYVHLEMLRFERKFDFVLHVDDELDVENIEISPMLIQPYVENAILHGLYNKTEKGTLQVSVREAEDLVLFEIEDDGIGREAASKFKFQSLKSHTSLGTLITEERLKLINKEHGATFEIEDLYSEGVATGTRVKIWVN